jgi:hypothetical protein
MGLRERPGDRLGGEPRMDVRVLGHVDRVVEGDEGVVSNRVVHQPHRHDQQRSQGESASGASPIGVLRPLHVAGESSAGPRSVPCRHRRCRGVLPPRSDAAICRPSPDASGRRERSRSRSPARATPAGREEIYWRIVAHQAPSRLPGAASTHSPQQSSDWIHAPRNVGTSSRKGFERRAGRPKGPPWPICTASSARAWARAWA